MATYKFSSLIVKWEYGPGGPASNSGPGHNPTIPPLKQGSNTFVHIYLTFLQEDEEHDTFLSLLHKATDDFFFPFFLLRFCMNFSFLEASLCTVPLLIMTN